MTLEGQSAAITNCILGGYTFTTGNFNMPTNTSFVTFSITGRNADNPSDGVWSLGGGENFTEICKQTYSGAYRIAQLSRLSNPTTGTGTFSVTSNRVNPGLALQWTCWSGINLGYPVHALQTGVSAWNSSTGAYTLNTIDIPAGGVMQIAMMTQTCRCGMGSWNQSEITTRQSSHMFNSYSGTCAGDTGIGSATGEGWLSKQVAKALSGTWGTYETPEAGYAAFASFRPEVSGGGIILLAYGITDWLCENLFDWELKNKVFRPKQRSVYMPGAIVDGRVIMKQEVAYV